MELEHIGQLESILGYLSVGVIILDATDLCIRYMNSYLFSHLEEPWSYQDVKGRRIDEILPDEMNKVIVPLLRRVAMTGESVQYAELPFEGFLQTRGRTYWRVVIKKASTHEMPGVANTLLVTVEDVTDAVRSRLHLNAIRHVSSAIVGAYALPLVLDRILQAVHEMVGSTHCAVMLIDHSISGYDAVQRTPSTMPHTVTIAAQKGVHLSPQDWRPHVSEQVLLGRVEKARHTLTIIDTALFPDIELPLLDDDGKPCRPGSVLCVPIFEPGNSSVAPYSEKRGTVQKKAVLGSIEVYHRHPRGFPVEEIKLLEQFAQQAGLAIQNARLFQSIDRLARAERRSAHQRENVMQAIPDGVIIFDPRWRVAETNHAIRKLMGWSSEIIGMTVIQVLQHSNAEFQQDITRFSDPIAELERRAQEGQIDEFKMIGADGNTYTMRCTYTPIRDDLGDTFAFVVILHDVTEQAAARERIEAKVVDRTKELAQRNEALQLAQVAQEMERARLELLLERLPSAVVLVSAQNNAITIINRHAVQLYQRMGLPLEPLDDLDKAAELAIGVDGELLFRQLTFYGASGSLIPDDKRPLYLALNKGEATEAELHIQGVDDQTIYLLANSAPLRAADGTITSAVLVFNDITNIKALEHARDDFFTTMAHELKTPLANIRAHLSALLAKDLHWSVEEQQDFLQTADEQVERLVGMINRVLNASRVEAGVLRLQLEPIFLPELLEDLQDRLEALIASSHRQLQIQYPPQLLTVAVLADYELIISVLTNLLSNAFRYAPEGDRVLLEAELVFDTQASDLRQPTSVTVRVSDRGPGMTQEQQKALFTRFNTFTAMGASAVDPPGEPHTGRRRRTARWSPATGLGLYISRGIIEAHNSTLTLKSSPGNGASFAFTLPVVIGKQQGESEERVDL